MISVLSFFPSHVIACGGCVGQEYKAERKRCVELKIFFDVLIAFEDVQGIGNGYQRFVKLHLFALLIFMVIVGWHPKNQIQSPTIGRTQEIYSGEHEAEKGSRGNVIFWQRNLNKAYNDNISKINCNFCLWISQIVEGIMAPKINKHQCQSHLLQEGTYGIWCTEGKDTLLGEAETVDLIGDEVEKL
ncbi:unnamed protein product [Lactuca saligna]|uniref:Uncharacterized protein n=1 Tax=Lactuca saligna TaxID=75948 RepID=A0AA35YSI7_LACSI|nr:unnamed protein product [Lactuca saligna]